MLWDADQQFGTACRHQGVLVDEDIIEEDTFQILSLTDGHPNTKGFYMYIYIYIIIYVHESITAAICLSALG